ncbi:uncharacterized protein LOC108105999 [Drosophila eugracilis]|uniref:uncharacterized protein LOC108105999 n=1 Tax=Drosophila eugracilis TaxID=29029 RepID=UPI0007E87075|nr:uncharacterized protein LOC108105999 [Drosophila eugracilis]
MSSNSKGKPNSGSAVEGPSLQDREISSANAQNFDAMDKRLKLLLDRLALLESSFAALNIPQNESSDNEGTDQEEDSKAMEEALDKQDSSLSDLPDGDDSVEKKDDTEKGDSEK